MLVYGDCASCRLEGQELMETEVQDSEADERPPGRGVPCFIAAFLGLFLLGGLVGIEAWPITGWKLYSEIRHGERLDWQVLGVDGQGVEVAIPPDAFPPGYPGVNYFLRRFDWQSDAERRSACRALGEAARAREIYVARMRLYRVLSAVRPGTHGSATAPPQRVRSYECSLI